MKVEVEQGAVKVNGIWQLYTSWNCVLFEADLRAKYAEKGGTMTSSDSPTITFFIEAGENTLHTEESEVSTKIHLTPEKNNPGDFWLPIWEISRYSLYITMFRYRTNEGEKYPMVYRNDD